MKILSVNVAQPQTLIAGKLAVQSAIAKCPVEGPVMVRRTNLDGDRQADLKVHGGVNKAVYAYPSEHYDFWRRDLGKELPYGMFGENLTTEGLVDSEVFIGDRYQIGSTILTVTQPRTPCYKLAARLEYQPILERMYSERRHGWYMSVEQEGTIAAGDEIRLIGRPANSITVLELISVWMGKDLSPELVARSLALDLSPKWKNKIVQRTGA
ncbi:MAG TPA: MOSC domain-containing protein [Terriglobales bacterium]|nr:MOSC domain-containing protein [Terriglobales bacterium]